MVIIQRRGGIPGAADWDIGVDKVSLLAFLLDLKSSLNFNFFFLFCTPRDFINDLYPVKVQ